MKALAYLLGARALDVSQDADRRMNRGIKWPVQDAPLEPMATTEATAAAWRRWRDAGPQTSTRPINAAPRRRGVAGTPA